MAYIGNDVDAIFLPESVNTSTSLRITGGDLIVDGNTLYVDESTNNVGIGTSTPATRLDIVGDVKVSGVITTTSASSSVSGMRNVIISTSDPTGGSDGDVWIKYIP